MFGMNEVVCILLVFLLLMNSASCLLHVVGGSVGWTVPDNKTYYQDWAKTRTFTVGDQLIFVYDPGHDNIISVSKKDFDDCHTNNPIEGYFRGPTALTLTTPGDFYYYSMYGLHCNYGQRLHVNVGNNDSNKQFNSRKLKEGSSGDGGAKTEEESPAAGIRGVAMGVLSGAAALLG